MVLYYLIPLVFHFFFTPAWFIFEEKTLISLIEFLGIIVSPIYLILFINSTEEKLTIKKSVFYFIIIIIINCLGIFISYCNWGLSTGNLLNPDSGTLLLIEIEIKSIVLISCISMLVSYLLKK